MNLTKNLVYTGIFLSVSIAALFSIISTKCSFHVVAKTNILKVVSNENQMLESWDLENVEIYHNKLDTIKYSGILEFNNKTKIEYFFHKTRDGQLAVEIIPLHVSKGKVVAKVCDVSGGIKLKLYNNFTIYFPNKEKDFNNFILPISGFVEIGELPYFGAEANNNLLLEGEVCLRGLSIINSIPYSTSLIKLEYGEMFSVHVKDSLKVENHWKGFVYTNNNSFKVIADVIAKQGKVTRYSGRGYPVKLTLISRLLNDTFLQGLWLILIWLIGFSRLIKELFIKTRRN